MSDHEELSGQEYERFVASYLVDHGFRGIEMTRTTGDYGVDILASKGGLRYAVQCKYYSSHVGISAVQQAASGMAFYGCQRAMVVTNNSFTAAAKALADKTGVILCEEVVPRSDPMKLLLGFIAVCYILAAGAVFAAKYREVGGFGNAEEAPELILLGVLLLVPVWAWASIRSLAAVIRWVRRK